MSRIGRMPIAIPQGVEIKVEKNNLVTVKGPKGTLTKTLHSDMIIKQEEGQVIIERPTESKEHKSLHGLSRTLLNNMVIGVTEGFQKTLQINGVGYRCQKQGKKLVLNLGFSHPVEVVAPEGVTLSCVSQTEVSVKGIDKVAVGQVAANIRSIRLPEPYHGYGIRYKDEVIVRKEGKTAGK